MNYLLPTLTWETKASTGAKASQASVDKLFGAIGASEGRVIDVVTNVNASLEESITDHLKTAQESQIELDAEKQRTRAAQAQADEYKRQLKLTQLLAAGLNHTVELMTPCRKESNGTSTGSGYAPEFDSPSVFEVPCDASDGLAVGIGTAVDDSTAEPSSASLAPGDDALYAGIKRIRAERKKQGLGRGVTVGQETAKNCMFAEMKNTAMFLKIAALRAAAAPVSSEEENDSESSDDNFSP